VNGPFPDEAFGNGKPKGYGHVGTARSLTDRERVVRPSLQPRRPVTHGPLTGPPLRDPGRYGTSPRVDRTPCIDRQPDLDPTHDPDETLQPRFVLRLLGLVLRRVVVMPCRHDVPKPSKAPKGFSRRLDHRLRRRDADLVTAGAEVGWRKREGHGG
jgi:hypothetical protein